MRRRAVAAAAVALFGAAVACGDGSPRLATAPSPPPTVAVVPTTTGATTPTTSTTTTATTPTTTSTVKTTSTMTTTTTTTTIPSLPRAAIPTPSTFSAQIDVIAPRDVPVPVRVVMAGLGIDGVVERTGVNDRGELDVPADARTLVWYRYGPSPGDPGSAVIAGHLDWKGVLGVFHQLAATSVGTTVTVHYSDGAERSFTVTAVELVDKPAVAVDGTFFRNGASVLRLVTCGGEFDDAVNSYKSNVIVTAVAN